MKRLCLVKHLWKEGWFEVIDFETGHNQSGKMSQFVFKTHTGQIVLDSDKFKYLEFILEY